MITPLAESLGQPLVDWGWVGRHLDDLRAATFEHVVLTAIAVAAGSLLAAPLALLAVRKRRTYAPITWVAGVLYTIPSIALFAILVPFTGLTMLSAEIGLVGYTLLILIRNFAAGLQSVPREVREAAIAMGYRPWRLLREVELPLALPVIVAGLRIATVTTIGLVTITALIGYGGLGDLIYDGLVRFFTTPLVVGAVLSVALSILADGAFILIGRALTPWTRARAAR